MRRKRLALKLYWRRRFVGLIRNHAWADFPYFGGELRVVHWPDVVRAWLKREGTPFTRPSRLDEGWRIKEQDGSSTVIGCLSIDPTNGLILWREGFNYPRRRRSSTRR